MPRHRVPFEEECTDEVSILRTERRQLRLAVDELRRGVAKLEAENDRLKARNKHLEDLASRKWWRRVE